LDSSVAPAAESLSQFHQDGDSRAQVGLVTHGRAFYRLTHAREYHVSSTDVNPAIAEPVSPRKEAAREEAPRAPDVEQQANERQQVPSRCRDLAEGRQLWVDCSTGVCPSWGIHPLARY